MPAIEIIINNNRVLRWISENISLMYLKFSINATIQRKKLTPSRGTEYADKNICSLFGDMCSNLCLFFCHQIVFQH